jgi:hypothetical protein
MNTLKKASLFFTLPLLMLFFSCFAEINGTVREGGVAELTLNTAMGPRTTALIRSLRIFAGEGAGAPILDGSAISHSMSLAPGVRTVSLRNSGPETLDGSIFISNIGDFLALPNAENRFISFTEGRQASSIVLFLDRASAPQLISLLSPEVYDYLSALMAPVAIGETMSAHEYLDLVASIYSRPLANEIAEARIRATIEFPRPVTAIRGGTYSGNKAEFDIPLLDILVLERPLRYEVSW